jgi:hypothetical protein
MATRKNFIWGFVVCAAAMALGCLAAVWLVLRLTGA